MAGIRTKKTVLVVEDDYQLLNALVDKLSREDFMVYEAKDGEEGLMMANRYHPDLILLDIIMPKIDGLSVMKKLRADNEWGKTVPIILLTNLSPDEERINKGIAEGEPAYYLVKTNWSMSDVADKIKEILHKPHNHNMY